MTNHFEKREQLQGEALANDVQQQQRLKQEVIKRYERERQVFAAFDLGTAGTPPDEMFSPSDTRLLGDFQKHVKDRGYKPKSLTLEIPNSTTLFGLVERKKVKWSGSGYRVGYLGAYSVPVGSDNSRTPLYICTDGLLRCGHSGVFAAPSCGRYYGLKDHEPTTRGVGSIPSSEFQETFGKVNPIFGHIERRAFYDSTMETNFGYGHGHGFKDIWVDQSFEQYLGRQVDLLGQSATREQMDLDGN